MTGNVLMRPDPKGRPFVAAMLLHGSLLGTFVLWNWLQLSGPKFGDPNAGGANIGVQVVDKIPLPHEGPTNPVAHNTESEAPQAPPDKVQQEKKEVIPPDAVKLNLHEDKKKKAKEESVKRHLPSFEKLQENQLTSRTPQQVSNKMFSQLPGTGQIGMGANTTLGTRFAGYAQQIQELIARNWQTGDVSVQTGPIVIARFELMKDGSIRNLTLLQKSGIPSLDYSVRRAIEGVRFPPLPVGFDEPYAKCEFSFELKK